jgi:arylsulfatase A-like enzyme
MDAAEACLLGLTVGGAVLLIEMFTAARAGLHYLEAVRAGGVAFELGGAYAVLFAATCLAGWLVARLAGRGVARRSSAVFLGLSISAVPILGGALAIHPAVASILLSWQIAPLLGILVLAVAAFLRGAARSDSALVPELAIAFAMSCLLGLAAGVAAAQQQSAVALLQLDSRAWLSVAQAALIAIPIALALSLALHGLHVRRSVHRLVATSAVLLSLCTFTLHVLPAVTPNPFRQADAVASPAPSVLLIAIDTLRADFVSGAGGGPGITPAMDALARDGIVFDRDHAAAPWTLASFGSILTSTYPSQHRAGLRDPETGRRFGLSSSLPTLAETLHAAGFATAAVLTNGYLSQRYGLGRGFDAYEDLIGIVYYHPVYRWLLNSLYLSTDPYLGAEREERRVVSMLDRLAGAGRPFFLLAHFMDPHTPYRAPEAFYDKPSGERTVVDHYRAEVRYVDHAIRDLLQALHASGAYDDLLIILTSDHGEELLEGRTRTAAAAGMHGHTLYEELLHVPLIVKLPHARLAGTHRAELVSGIDVAPTILGRVGVAAPPTFVGLDLFGEHGEANRFRDRAVFAEGLMVGPELRAAMRGDQKIIQPTVPSGGKLEQSFDLASDPLEKRSITDPDELHAFAGLRNLMLFRARAGWDDRRAEPSVELSAVQLEQLKALGYVAGSQRSP